ncbi:MAG: hypothetical protein HC904_06830 [Blastochloris sp.]|nr:hypothetical protein [Blastochloris sp.]
MSNSLVAGLFPIFWGISFDALVWLHQGWGAWEWNVFSVVYLVLAGIAGLALAALSRVPETRAMTTQQFYHELFMETPVRALSRLLGRRPV